MSVDLLEKYSEDIESLKNYEEVDAIVVFGSYSKGTVKPLSDLDVCVILNYKTSRKKQKEILSFGTDEFDLSLFHKLPLSLQYRVLHKGKVLHSEIDIVNLKIKVTNRWIDFKPILNRLYKSRNYPLEV